MFFKRRAVCSALAILLLTATPTIGHTAEAEDPFKDSLLGDAGGVRKELSDAGVGVTVDYKADLWQVTSGRNEGSNYMDNLDVKFDLDGEKIFGIKGNKMLVYFISNAGGETNGDRIGSVEGMDNLEVTTNAVKLYELWMEQSFMEDQLSVLVGLHDLNAEFAVTDLSANFIKPTMQVMQTFAQSGQNGPSIFPSTSLAGRVRISPTEESYISAAVFDGVPGNPAHPRATRIDLNDNDGLLLIAEAGITPKAPDQKDSTPNKVALGAWTYTEDMDDVVDVDASGNPEKRTMSGAYLLSSYQFYHDAAAGRDLGAFLRAGLADGDTAQVSWDYELGVVANGWVPNRPDAEIGVGFTQAHNGNKYVRSVGGVADDNEYGMELYYRDTVTNGITIQPDVQYIINPGSDTVTDDALVVGVRVDINF